MDANALRTPIVADTPPNQLQTYCLNTVLKQLEPPVLTDLILI